MSRFVLDDGLKTGEPRVDAQHEELFAMFSDLHEASVSGAAFLVLSNILDRLAAYVDHHFDEEQSLMVRSAYPPDEMLRHAAQHAELRARTLALIAEYRSTRSQNVMPLALFLAEWLSEHIRKSDSLLVAHLRAQGA